MGVSSGDGERQQQRSVVMAGTVCSSSMTRYKFRLAWEGTAECDGPALTAASWARACCTPSPTGWRGSPAIRGWHE